VHPKYQDLDDWTGRETADFVYIDRDGVFTQYLQTTCFGGFSTLQCGNGEGFQPIEYFIEVKTTTLGCNTRFFMSKWQYNRVSPNPGEISSTLADKVPLDEKSSNQTGRASNTDLSHHPRLQSHIRHRHACLR
jgi:hypothetical protein